LIIIRRAVQRPARLLDGLFVVCGIIVMVLFVRSARRIEPFVADEHRPVRR
jgi:hypothetical protein